MKCPFCSEEMLSGYLQNGQRMLWGQTKKKGIFLPNGENDFYVDVGYEGLKGSFLKSDYCSHCHKIIISTK